jgi:hypothetical protein
MKTERCPHDGKKLEYDGVSWMCRHCGFHDCMPAYGPRLTQPDAKELVRRLRERPLSPKCYGHRHQQCEMSGCPCVCHRRFAAALRREAAQVEHDGGPAAAERAEELRRRADQVES